jgi:hypothetical protein
MIVEMRTYTFHPGAAAKFFNLYEAKALDLQRSTLGNLIGYFTSEIGELNKTVHLWGYESLDERQRRRAALAADDDWRAFVAEILPLLAKQESRILLPTGFSPIR